MSDYDADRRALARCEDDYLREPAWRTGDDLSDEHLRDLEARHLPDDVAACTAEHVRAESARCARLRDVHGDDEAATSAERALAWYVLRALAAQGNPLARASTEAP